MCSSVVVHGQSERICYTKLSLSLSAENGAADRWYTHTTQQAWMIFAFNLVRIPVMVMVRWVLFVVLTTSCSLSIIPLNKQHTPAKLANTHIRLRNFITNVRRQRRRHNRRRRGSLVGWVPCLIEVPRGRQVVVRSLRERALRACE